jgi:type I restriction enzyme S subunit
MRNLKKYRFSDLYSMGSGISSKPEQAGHGSPFLSFSTVFNNYFIPDKLKDLMDTSDKDQVTYSIKEGDIFLTRTSETINELGMSCVALEDYPKATFSGFVKRLRPKQENIVYPRFMGFYLRSVFFRKTMTNNAIMTLRASLNEEIFSYLNLYLPDFSVQKKIGDTLFMLNSKIELNNRINAELEAMAKTNYDYWFVQFDFPNAKGKPYKASGGKMVWSEELKREIPMGWEIGTLNDLGEIIGGSTPSTEQNENFDSNGTPWITPKDLSLNTGNKFITRGELSVSKKGLQSASLNLMPPGTILLSSRAPIGYMAIARENVTTNQGFKSFVPSKGYSTSIVYYLVKNALPIIVNHASGSTFKEVSGSILRSIKILLPSKDIARALTEILEPVFKRQNNLELENQKLSELRDWLLPMLMNGQVKIGDVERELELATEPKVVYNKLKKHGS